MSKNLVIVESPAKARTIERFLGKDYEVRSSFGHVRDLSKKQLGVDIEHGFKPNYEITPDKKKVVTDLKKSTKKAEKVWLASDEDREGEAIAWHLIKVLELNEERTNRIVFHEITQSAIEDAIKQPRTIDKNLVDAQQARRILDRLVGFELSPVLWRKVKPALSAGRVQSVAVRLIVEREKEIKNFKPTSSYKITALFDVKTDKGKGELAAELPKRFKTKEEAMAFLQKCQKASFTIEKIEKKPGKKSPAPPFTTSTLQQEASRKLGYPVSKTMTVAQQLYESGKITYMRTDSVNLSNMALANAKKEIMKQYGEQYSKTRKYSTKSKSAQEAHEAIRPTYLNHQTISGDDSQKRLYDLIWKRTIASQMADAQLERTNVTIGISTTDEKLSAKGEVIKFDGFLKVYMESSDDDEQDTPKGVLPPLTKGQVLDLKKMDAIQRFSQHPPRYTEASLVKKLEELGIGRPSTYAPIISTIQKRGYVTKEDRDGYPRKFEQISLSKERNINEETKTEKTGYEKNKMFPTDIGTVVNDFLMQYFQNIMDYNFTARVEEEFDEIAMGKKKWDEMIKEFYHPFHERVEETLEKSERAKGERFLGVDPKTGKNVYVKIGRYGPIAQIGDTESEEKPKFAGLRKNQSIETITLEEALELFKFPRTIGEYEDKELVVSIGRFGPYVRHDSKFYSLKKEDDPFTIEKDRAIELIEEKRERERKKTIRDFNDENGIKILKGRYGPYISMGRENYRIPKGKEAEKLTLEECKEIIEKSAKSGKGTKTTTKTAAKSNKSPAKTASKTKSTKSKTKSSSGGKTTGKSKTGSKSTSRKKTG
ncbi:MAG: type I DNA topoisomerase [Bacteroidales bacterium]|nr:type I DNA topoisomerase [Bacteroidales bacterium]